MKNLLMNVRSGNFRFGQKKQKKTCLSGFIGNAQSETGKGSENVEGLGG